MTKRIGIDFHVADGLYQGTRSHVLGLFSRVISRCADREFYLFTNDPAALRGRSPEFASPHVHLVRMPRSNPVKRLCWQLPRLQVQYRLDLLHTQYILPIACAVPCVVTIHDILFENYPQFFPAFFTVRSKILMRRSAHRAAHIFTSSAYSKKEIGEKYKIDHAKITVIQNGVDTGRFQPGGAGREIIEKYGLASKGYILSVGRLEPRKNYPVLIKAYAAMKQRTLPLVIVGQRHFGFEAIFHLIDGLGLRRDVIVMENIGDGELAALYRHARLFVYPTFAEGFGMPVLEAMASGVPVVSSNTTSIPEVVGRAGVLIDPDDADGLASAMKALLSDDRLYAGLVQAGIDRAAEYRWEASAQKVQDVYAGILNG